MMVTVSGNPSYDKDTLARVAAVLVAEGEATQRAEKDRSPRPLVLLPPKRTVPRGLTKMILLQTVIQRRHLVIDEPLEAVRPNGKGCYRSELPPIALGVLPQLRRGHREKSLLGSGKMLNALTLPAMTLGRNGGQSHPLAAVIKIREIGIREIGAT